MKRWTRLFLGLLLILAGCQTVPDQSEPDSGPQLLTVTSPPQRLTPTPSGTAIPTAAPTSRPSQTPRPTWTPSPTPLPTLPPDEAQAVVNEFLTTNGGCELPCWWGYVPSETPWQEAYTFLSTVALERISLVYTDLQTRERRASVVIPVTEEILPPYNIHDYFVREGLIQEIYLELTNREAAFYTLPAPLTTYGPPGEVWVSTYSREREGLPFHVTLVYPERKFIINYGLQAELRDNKVRGCYPARDIVHLYIWPPEQDVSLTGLVEEMPAIRGAPLRPLEEATNMSIDEFYDAFTDPNSTTCLETPIDLWPAPGE
jgi:hypothetical protein